MPLARLGGGEKVERTLMPIWCLGGVEQACLRYGLNRVRIDF